MHARMRARVHACGMRSCPRPSARLRVAPRAELTGKAVGHVHGALVHVAQQHAHDALLGVAGDAVVVVHDAEQHQRVQDDLGGGRSCCRAPHRGGCGHCHCIHGWWLQLAPPKFVVPA